MNADAKTDFASPDTSTNHARGGTQSAGTSFHHVLSDGGLTSKRASNYIQSQNPSHQTNQPSNAYSAYHK